MLGFWIIILTTVDGRAFDKERGTKRKTEDARERDRERQRKRERMRV